MERAVVAIEGRADRLLADGLMELRDVLGELGDSALVMGGLMTRLWLHLRPRQDLPTRETVDLDLGIDRKALRITGERRVVSPLLEGVGFEPVTGHETYRYTKKLSGGRLFRVDLLVASGASRADPPQVEAGIPSVAAPGLAYGLLRGAVPVSVALVDGSVVDEVVLRLPQLDAAFVMKANLVEVRAKPGKVETDTVDATMLAALCLDDPGAVSALAKFQKRSDVKRALAFLDSIDDPRGRAARRVEAFFASEYGAVGGAPWASQLARALLDAIQRRVGEPGSRP